MLPCSSKLKLQPAVLSPQRPVASLHAYFPFFKFFSFMHLRTLPSSVSCKSFVCHCYENCRVCTNNSQSRTPRARAAEPGPAEILPSSTSVSVNSVFSVDSLLIPASPHSPRFTDHRPLSPIPFLFTFLRTLLRSRKTQLFCFQAIPNSLPKTPGVGWGIHPSSQAAHLCYSERPKMRDNLSWRLRNATRNRKSAPCVTQPSAHQPPSASSTST